VLRPLVELMESRGHEVTLTARPLSHTRELLEDWGHPHTVIGHHGGSGRLGKARAAAGRVPRLWSFARGRHFDRALAHGSTDLPPACRMLRIPNTTMFDYEWASLQHQLGCRPATRVLVPEAIPPERLERYGVRPPKLRRYPGLKEEYYLADFEPDAAVPAALGLDADRVLVVVRTPSDYALYHRRPSPLFPALLDRLGRRHDVHAVVLPRTEEQGRAVRRLGLPSLVVPEHAVDAQSLIAFSDLVVSAGGTINREAVALGVPVWTTFGGRLGGVDEALLREGRLRVLEDPDALELEKRQESAGRVRRDPRHLLDLLLPV
jgi:uncharacterized protein